MSMDLWYYVFWGSVVAIGFVELEFINIHLARVNRQLVDIANILCELSRQLAEVRELLRKGRERG